MARRGALALAALVACLPVAVRLAPAPAVAHPSVAPVQTRLRLIGSVRLEPAGENAHADVAVAGNLAFVGKWSGPCPGTGVDIVDIANPGRPVLAGRTPANPGTSEEMMRPARIGSREVLAIGLQDCRRDPPGVARAGLELVDVTDPRNAAELSFFSVSGLGARVVGVHELDVTRTPGGRWLALLAVPGLEAATAGADGRGGKGDLLLVDISDPVHPVLTGSWGVLGEPSLGPAFYQGVRRGNDARTLLHSARASADGRLAYLSYWDAGVLLLDIRDPAQPRYLGRTTFSPDQEGNAHSVAEAPGGGLLVEADEVLDPYQLRLGSPALAVPAPVTGAGFGPRLAGGAVSLTGEVAAAGNGCSQGQPPGGIAGRVALVERGGCRFDEKVARAQRAGATGVIVYDDASVPDDLGAMGGSTHVDLPEGPANVAIPAVLVRRDAGLRLRDAAPVTASVAASFSGWGGLRLWNLRDRAHPALLGTYLTPDAVDPAVAGRGLFSVHNPQVAGSIVIASWYSDGVRVIDVSDPRTPRFVSAWTGAGAPLDAPPVDVWGVALSGDLVLASDRNFGLYVLRRGR
jgi:hypothetical protein